MNKISDFNKYVTFLKKHKVLIWINILLLILLASLFRIFLNIQILDKKGVMSVSFLNVGQGDSLLIQTPAQNNVLIDTGPDKKALLEIINQLNYFDKKIDLIISTHAHSDHIAGLSFIADRYEIFHHVSKFREHDSNQVTNLFQVLDKNRISQIELQAGDRIVIDPKHSIYIDILWPADRIKINDENDNSISTLLVYDDINFLMTGDAGIRVENYLVEEFGEKLSSAVLKLGHHGSKTSSSVKFLNSVSPKYAIISAGENNKYGHPHQETIDNLEIYLQGLSESDKKQKQEWSADWIQNTKNGNVTFKTNGKMVWLEN